MKRVAAIILLLASPALAVEPFLNRPYDPNRKPAEKPREKQSEFHERDRLLAEATARARKLQTAPKNFRVWQVLGGKAGKSEAALVDLENGVLTLQKKDGTFKTVTEARLGRVDRMYLDQWKKKQRNTTPGLIRPAETTKPKAATISRQI